MTEISQEFKDKLHETHQASQVKFEEVCRKFEMEKAAAPDKALVETNGETKVKFDLDKRLKLPTVPMLPQPVAQPHLPNLEVLKIRDSPASPEAAAPTSGIKAG